jgi:hypothetical protein
MGGANARILFQKGKNMKILSFVIMIAVFLLGACSPTTIANSEGEQPEAVVEVVGEVPSPVVEEQPASVAAEAGGYMPVEVVQMSVEFEAGSSAVAKAVIHYDLPDSCAQLEHVRTVQDGAIFFIALGSVHSKAEGCIQDSLAQRVSVPLNIADLPVGDYAVVANGVRAEFPVTESGSNGDLRTAVMPNYLDDVAVNGLGVVNGVGSPLPIHAVIQAALPKSCGQLGEVQMSREGETFFVRLTAELPAQTECNNDSLPMPLEMPLNIAGLHEGTYEVNVNGVTTTFELPVK